MDFFAYKTPIYTLIRRLPHGFLIFSVMEIHDVLFSMNVRRFMCVKLYLPHVACINSRNLRYIKCNNVTIEYTRYFDINVKYIDGIVIVIRDEWSENKRISSISPYIII